MHPNHLKPPSTALPAAHHHIVTEANKFLGITKPVSLAHPDQKEIELTKKLIQTLKSHNLFENVEEAQKREEVLGRLYTMVKDFVKKMGMKRGLSESLAAEAGGTIFAFGSYRLGVHGTGADIDTLCVVPRHVTREDFFTYLFETLKESPEVTELAAVPDAYVPVIKMEFSGIPIDLLFARLGVPQVPNDIDISDNNILRNLDERDVRSLNGSRVTDDILRLVPDVNEFRTALRCIKLWAKRRAIYSNVMGFLGGVAWAMLVARVCQLYPNATAGTLISKFFLIMYKWQWPQPVLLKPMEEGPLNVRIWNPRIYPADRQHRMPIITPAYPSMCATHNVTSSTHTIMVEQFKEASEVVAKIMLGEAEWDTLFVSHDFFTRYRHYLQIVASSKTKEQQLKWGGMVESRLRQLIMRLEVVDGIILAHPFIKGTDRNYICSSDEEWISIGHGTWPLRDSASDGDMIAAEAECRKVIYTTAFYVGLLIKIQPKSDNGSRRQLDISWPSREFTELVKSWDQYEADDMAVTVQNLKRSQIPKDVVAAKAPVKEKKRQAAMDDFCDDSSKKRSKLRSDSTDQDSLSHCPSLNSDQASVISPSLASSNWNGYQETN